MLGLHEIILAHDCCLSLDDLDDFLGDVGVTSISLADGAAVLGTGLDRSHQSPVAGDCAIVKGVDKLEHILFLVVGLLN